MNEIGTFLLGFGGGLVTSAVLYKTVIEKRMRAKIYQECYDASVAKSDASQVHLSQAQEALNN